MKILIAATGLVLAVLCSGCASTGTRPRVQTPATRSGRAFKGFELYSWRTDGTWQFALLPGTNRVKPESMVKATPLTLAEIERRFDDHPEGENIFLVVEPGFESPDPTILRDLQAAARKSNVCLIIP